MWEQIHVRVYLLVCERVNGGIPFLWNSLESRDCSHGNMRMGISLVTKKGTPGILGRVGISPWLLGKCGSDSDEMDNQVDEFMHVCKDPHLHYLRLLTHFHIHMRYPAKLI